MCIGLSDPPREVDHFTTAKFLQFIFAHPNLLSSASDILVVFMTFSRLRILWHAESRRGADSSPRPIVLQVLLAYTISIVMDVPNFFIYDTLDCSNKTEDDAPLDKDCWSFVEASAITTTTYWLVWIYFKTIVIRVLPLLALVIMNVMIIWKLHKILKKKNLLCTSDNTSRTRNETVVADTSVGVEPVSESVAGQAASKLERREGRFLCVPTIFSQVTSPSTSRAGSRVGR